MNILKNSIILAVFASSTLATQSFAAAPPAIRESVAVCDPNAPTHCVAPTSSGGTPVTPTPSPVTTTQTSGSVTTHGTFQSALSASTTRKGCTLQNTSTDTEYVFFGATASATTGNSFQLLPGQVVLCSAGDIVADDNVAITSKTLDSASYVVSNQ